jgi:hypothetical protein
MVPLASMVGGPGIAMTLLMPQHHFLRVACSLNQLFWRDYDSAARLVRSREGAGKCGSLKIAD